MRPRDSIRIARLEEHRSPEAVTEARIHIEELRWIVLACAMISEEAIAAGIDPEQIGILQVGRDAAEELERLGDPPESICDFTDSGDDWTAAHPGEPPSGAALVAEIVAIGSEYADGRHPGSFGSFAEWLGWAWVRHKWEIDDDA